MARTVKYRLWIPGVDDEPGEMIGGDSLAFEEYLPLTDLLSNDRVMQWTGLVDSTGTEIYEGDILKGHCRVRGRQYRLIGKVVYEAPAFEIHGVKQYDGWRQSLDSSYAVIGNVYENPELVRETARKGMMV